MADSLKNMLSLKGKTALVTGGAQNFGLEIATGLAEMGADLIVTSRDEAKAQKAAAEYAEKHGIKAMGVALDLLEEKSVIAAFDKAMAEMGSIDILVNNAGGHGSGPTGDVENESIDCFNQYIQANLTGTFVCIREFTKRMKDKGGSIVNIASISSLLGRDRSVYEGCDMIPNPIPYTAAKAGVIGLTYDCASDLAKYGIRVNAVSPGGFERGQPDKFVKAYSAKVMLKRMGKDGEDLKGAVAFLASDAAGYITGHNLYVDGGFSRLS
ncbi:MAG: SDR family NAD(P)-dependent oxidoreductase [Planctomycetota bacterium]